MFSTLILASVLSADCPNGQCTDPGSIVIRVPGVSVDVAPSPQPRTAWLPRPMPPVRYLPLTPHWKYKAKRRGLFWKAKYKWGW